MQFYFRDLFQQIRLGNQRGSMVTESNKIKDYTSYNTPMPATSYPKHERSLQSRKMQVIPFDSARLPLIHSTTPRIQVLR